MKRYPLTIRFASEEDRDRMYRYWKMATEQDGTVTGVWAGIMCSALRKAAIRHPRPIKPENI